MASQVAQRGTKTREGREACIRCERARERERERERGRDKKRKNDTRESDESDDTKGR